MSKSEATVHEIHEQIAVTLEWFVIPGGSQVLVRHSIAQHFLELEAPCCAMTTLQVLRGPGHFSYLFCSGRFAALRQM